MRHPADKWGTRSPAKDGIFDRSDLIIPTRPPKIRNRRWSILAVYACHDKLQFYISDFIVQNFLSILISLRQGGKKCRPIKSPLCKGSFITPVANSTNTVSGGADFIIYSRPPPLIRILSNFNKKRRRLLPSPFFYCFIKNLIQAIFQQQLVNCFHLFLILFR